MKDIKVIKIVGMDKIALHRSEKNPGQGGKQGQLNAIIESLNFSG